MNFKMENSITAVTVYHNTIAHTRKGYICPERFKDQTKKAQQPEMSNGFFSEALIRILQIIYSNFWLPALLYKFLAKFNSLY